MNASLDSIATPNPDGAIAVRAEADPVDFFVPAKVPLSVLTRHGHQALKGLHSLGDEKIVICFLAQEQIRTERVTRIALLECAYRLGWTPYEYNESDNVEFTEAVLHVASDGTHWYAGEGCFDEEDYPIAWPAEERARATAGVEAEHAAYLETLAKAEEEIVQKQARGVYLRSLDIEPPAVTMEEAVALVRQWRAENAAELEAKAKAMAQTEVNV